MHCSAAAAAVLLLWHCLLPGPPKHRHHPAHALREDAPGKICAARDAVSGCMLRAWVLLGQHLTSRRPLCSFCRAVYSAHAGWMLIPPSTATCN
jgi:hypothetical protein